MADSFNKKEKEKKRRKKRKAKEEKRLARKAAKLEAGKKSFEDMISYVDAHGNIVDEPPDPSEKIEVNAEDIILGIPKKEHVEDEKTRSGRVKFFNDEKGFGFIVDDKNQAEIFVHINSVNGEIREGSRVSFEVEKGLKGPNAVNVEVLD
ncbi:MAG: cold shock domain-containing protein [Saprospiraceae bacterium]|nr:cold shock domain-containing protein [Saprospiraceae bacterium]